MTTIATDGKTMAADGQAEIDRVITASARSKIRLLPDGSIVGCAGDTVNRIAFCDWLAATCGENADNSLKPPRIKPDSFAALRLYVDGRAVYYDERGAPTPAELPAAIGSGQVLAIGAMEAGASAEDAVRIAAKRDPHTGGDITVMRPRGASAGVERIAAADRRARGMGY